MRKLLFIILILFSSNCFAAELLVKASPHWMDKLTQEEVNKMDKFQRQSYDARSQIGDIIVVRPDGWRWGKEECQPNFVVVKVPQMTIIEAKQYEESLSKEILDERGKIIGNTLIRVRKYALPKSDITAINADTTTLDKNTVTSSLITKTGATDEVEPPVIKSISYYLLRFRNFVRNYLTKPAYAVTQLKKTVMPSGGDYTSLEACMNANEQNLVDADQYLDVEIDGDWSGGSDTSAVVYHNYITDSTRYVNIYTTSSARHKGVWSNNYYNLSITNPSSGGYSQGCIDIYSGYIYVTGLQVELILDSPVVHNNYRGIMASDAANYVYISKNIIKETIINTDGDYDNGGIRTKTTNGIIYIWNNIIYGWVGASENAGLHFNIGSGETIYAYNNTLYNNFYGMFHNNLDATLLVLKNNISNNSESKDYYFINGPSVLTTADNISGDTTSPDTEWRSKDVTFVSEVGGSENLHLDASDTSGAIGGGTVDPGTGLFSDDIDGESRGASWDIGVDQLAAAGVDDSQVIFFN